MKSFNLSNILVWVSTITISILLLYFLGGYFQNQVQLFEGKDSLVPVEATVTQINGINPIEDDLYSELPPGKDILFMAKITSGKHSNEIVEAIQALEANYALSSKEIEVGDSVILYAPNEDVSSWTFVDYKRINGIYILGAVLALALILFGRLKGLNTLISLILTFCFIFGVFIPSVLAGFNIYSRFPVKFGNKS